MGCGNSVWKISADFCAFEVKLNSERYVSDILEPHLLPWADKHFQGLPWSLQDSAQLHGSKMTQTWFQRKIPSFIAKNCGLLKPRTLIPWTSLSGPFWRQRFQLVLTLLQNWRRNGTQSLMSRTVPPVMHLWVDLKL